MSLLQLASDFFATALREPGGAYARKYLQDRELTVEEVERFELGCAARALDSHAYAHGFHIDDLLAVGLYIEREGRAPFPRFRDRLMFPIHDEKGHVVGFSGRSLNGQEPKYLNSPTSPAFQKGELLYNLNRARKSIAKLGTCVVVEGNFDAIRLAIVGIENVVAPLGTSMTPAQAAMIADMAATAVLIPDGDEPGMRAAFKSADLLLSHGIGVHVATLPAGSDPDSYAATHGYEGIVELFRQTTDVLELKVKLLKDAGMLDGAIHKRREAFDRLLPTLKATTEPLRRAMYLERAAQIIGIPLRIVEDYASPNAPADGRPRHKPRFGKVKESTIAGIDMAVGQ